MLKEMTLSQTLSSLDELFTSAPKPRFAGVQASSRYLTMRDGIQIAIDIMMPLDLPAGDPLPAVMIMARYWRSMELRVPDRPKKAWQGPRDPIADDLIGRGFAVVIVDARGTGASTGVSHHPWTPEEIADYGEVAAWIAEQDWSNGNVGAVGISYEGATAQRLIANSIPVVKGVVPQEIEFDVYTDVALPGGIFNLAFIKAWSESNTKLDSDKPSSLFPFTARLFVKGVRPVNGDREMLAKALADHQQNTDVYQAISQITYRDDMFGDTGATLDDFSMFRYNREIEASGVPIFSWGSWLDAATADSVLKNFNTYDNPQIAVIGAWKHEMSAHGSPYLKPGTKPDPLQANQWDAVAQFFDATLVQDQPPQGKTLYYTTLGAEGWQKTDAFPPPDAKLVTWYFRESHQLSTDMPEVENAADRYAVDFDATTGKTNRWHTQMARPLVYPDRAKADARLLTYTSAPLANDMTITGYPVVTLYVASDADDSAFFVYLEDVDPQGVVRYITEGQLRGIHRQLADQSAPYCSGMPYRTFRREDASRLPIGEMIELTFGLQPTSALIKRGHRIRVAIAGADKDTFARIPATGQPVWDVSRNVRAASRIELPVMDSIP